MAVTFGQLAARILRETARDISFQTAVQDCIVTAIKELEREQYWLFEKEDTVTILEGNNTVAMPSDFVAMSTARLMFGNTYYTEIYGFVPVTNHEIFNYQRNVTIKGQPFIWSLFGNDMVVYPTAAGDYNIELRYFHNDGSYPVNYDDTSIWFGDLTADLTRYKALQIFYNDELQAEEKAQFYEARAEKAIAGLRTRANQRQTINRLSI